MNPMSQSCQPERIADFLAGTLSDEDCAALESHMSQCARCDQQLADATAGQPFWDDVREFLKPRGRIVSGTGSESVDHRGEANSSIDRELKSLLDPTDDPRMLGRFGGYEVAGVIGRGGMGLVFKGLDVSLDRYVAIKVLNPICGSSSAARTRFAREAKAAASVVHDNVVPIYGVDEFNGVPYLVMPYVKTESLQQRIDREAPLSLETTLEIAAQIARGLAVAHDQGLVHRDIKPSNILMPSSVSRVQITDFGLARTIDDASLTQSGVIAGTPQYMSPEQARGDAVDGRTDQFSLGSVIYAMLTGHPPFRSDTTYGTLRRIIDDAHRPVAQVQPSVPIWLGGIIDRLLSKDPEDRFVNTSDVADHLEDCLAHHRQPATVVLPKLKVGLGKRRGAGGSFTAKSILISLLVVTLFAIASAIRLGDWHNADVPRRVRIEELPLPPLTFDDRELVRIENEIESIARDLGAIDQ